MNGPKVVAALTCAIAERGAAPRSLTLDNVLNASIFFGGKTQHSRGRAFARLTAQ
jgi:hypothetical protein